MVGMASDNHDFWAFVNTVMNPLLPEYAGIH